MKGGSAIAVGRDLAARVEREASADPPAQIALLWRLAYGRENSTDERTASLDFLRDQASHYPIAAPSPGQPTPLRPQSRALANLCQAVLSSNEFLYID